MFGLRLEISYQFSNGPDGMVGVHGKDVQAVMCISHISMTMSNHACNRNKHLHIRIVPLTLVREMGRSCLLMIHLIMDYCKNLIWVHLRHSTVPIVKVPMRLLSINVSLQFLSPNLLRAGTRSTNILELLQPIAISTTCKTVTSSFGGILSGKD